MLNYQVFLPVPKKKKREILYNIAVTDYAAEGKAIARYEGKVLFIQGAVPGANYRNLPLANMIMYLRKKLCN